MRKLESPEGVPVLHVVFDGEINDDLQDRRTSWLEVKNAMDVDGCENSLKHPASNGVWFVYGSLKPSELGFRQIEHLIDDHEPARVDGYRIWIRDGLPEYWRVKSIIGWMGTFYTRRKGKNQSYSLLSKNLKGKCITNLATLR